MRKYRIFHIIASIFLSLFIASTALLFTLNTNWYYKLSKDYCDKVYHTKTEATTITSTNYENLILQLSNPRSTALSLPSYEITQKEHAALYQFKFYLFCLIFICIFSFVGLLLLLRKLQTLQYYHCFIIGPLLSLPSLLILLALSLLLFSHPFTALKQLLLHQEAVLFKASTLFSNLFYNGYAISHFVLCILYVLILSILSCLTYKMVSRPKNYF